MMERSKLVEEGAFAFSELCETELNDVEIRRAFISELAKYLVYNGFRNGPIEELHAGVWQNLPDSVSRISNDEMKQLMKAATTSVANLLEVVFLNPEVISSLEVNPFTCPPEYWEDPDWDKIDAERKELYDILTRMQERQRRDDESASS